MKILVDGVIQGKIIKYTKRKEFYEAEVEVIIPQEVKAQEMSALIQSIDCSIQRICKK